MCFDLDSEPPIPPIEGGAVEHRDLVLESADGNSFAAFAALPEQCRRLLSLLIADPPVPYADISASLGMAVGSIGPSRARCLDALRRSPQLSALSDRGGVR